MKNEPTGGYNMNNENAGEKKGIFGPVNINEEFVQQHVLKAIKELGACGCETCYANACALALNGLRPQYVTSKRGALLTEITETKVSNQADIIVEATKAVKKVMANPHH
jgi:competence protein ComFB